MSRGDRKTFVEYQMFLRVQFKHFVAKTLKKDL